MKHLPAELREYLANEGGKLTPKEQRVLIEQPDVIKQIAVQLLRKKDQEKYPDGTEGVPSFDCC